MYEKLIIRLREIRPEEFGDAWDFAFACQQAMHEAADAIEELSKKRESACWGCKCEKIEPSRWIPVTERLPENAGVYLCDIHGDYDNIYIPYSNLEALVFYFNESPKEDK